MISRRWVGATAILAACSAPAGGPAPAGPEPAPAGTVGDTAAALVPVGRGTLRQDEATIQLRQGALLIKVTPLTERVIRLLAPDTYDRLRALAASRSAELAGQSTDPPELFLVSFFSYEPDVEYQPEGLQIAQQGRLLRPQAILPVSGEFGRQRLNQQETQMAVYAFEPPIEYDRPMTVRYGTGQSDEWARIIPRLEAERARVRARGGP